MRKYLNLLWISGLCLLTLAINNFDFSLYEKFLILYTWKSTLYRIGRFASSVYLSSHINTILWDTVFLMEFIIQPCLIIHGKRSIKTKKFLRGQIKSTCSPIWVKYSELNKNALTLFKQQILFKLIEKC